MKEVFELVGFSGIMMLGQISPGPDMLLLTRTAIKEGARAGREMALGIATGLAVQATLAVAGFAVLVERTPVVRLALCWLAAGYLLWMAFRIFVTVIASKSAAVTWEPCEEIAPQRPFFRGLICNLSNLKVVLLLAAVCAPFLHGAHPEWWPFALVSIIVIQGAGLWILWVCLLQWMPIRRWYERAARWIDLIFSIILVTLAGRLLIG